MAHVGTFVSLQHYRTDITPDLIFIKRISSIILYILDIKSGFKKEYNLFYDPILYILDKKYIKSGYNHTSK